MTDLTLSNLKFEWDSDKAKLNLKRHGISFEEAIEAFFDPNALDSYDTDHSWQEDRYNLIGLSSRRLLFVVYTERANRVIRLISARKAEEKHQSAYEQYNE